MYLPLPRFRIHPHVFIELMNGSVAIFRFYTTVTLCLVLISSL